MKDTVTATPSPNDGASATWLAMPRPMDGPGPPESQPHMQVDLEMGQKKAKKTEPVSVHQEFIEAARHNALRTSTAEDLRTLVLRLEVACETARVAAISALQYPDVRSGGDEKADHNSGFAELFSALRRARAELAARELGRQRRVSSTSPRDPRSVGPPPSSRNAAVEAQKKAQR